MKGVLTIANTTTIRLNAAKLDTNKIDTNGTYGFMIPIEFTDTQHKELVTSLAESIGNREGWTAIDESHTTTFISMDFYDEGAPIGMGNDLSISYRLYVATAPLDENEIGMSDQCLFVPIELSVSERNQLKQIMVMRFAKLLADC